MRSPGTASRSARTTDDGPPPAAAHPGRAALLLGASIALLSGCGGGGGGGAAAPQHVVPPAPRPEPPAPNRAPVITGPHDIAVDAIELHPFQFDLSTVLSDPDGDTLTLSFSESQSTDWIGIDGMMLSGIPTELGLDQLGFNAFDIWGASTSGTLHITVRANAPPMLATPLEPMLVAAGANISFDTTQAGTTFVDPDGDPMHYELELLSPPQGLRLDGLNVAGAMTDVGSVVFRIKAYDDYGGNGEDIFSFAVAGPEPGAPVLPATPYSYADEEQPWPRDYAKSSIEITPFWDTAPRSGNPITNAGATLGRVLFYDKRLSLTNTHSCGSCHVQSHAFASPERFDIGVGGVPLTRNAMSLVNVRYNVFNRFFSDERADGLEALALMPIADPFELGNSLPLLEQKIAATSFYPPLFEAAFGSAEVTRERIALALAQFLRSIVSYRTTFDEAHSEPVPGYHTDPATVFTPEELRGEELFGELESFCDGCHDQPQQIMVRPANNGLDAVPNDPGAGGGKFRAASLRSIAHSAPYMHDGRFATLREVIDHYDHGVQVGPDTSRSFVHPDGTPVQLNLFETEKLALEAFLNALTDEPLLTDPRFADPF